MKTSQLCVLLSTLVLTACASAPATSPAPAAPAASAATAGILKSGVYLQNFDKSVRPQDDFYQWLASTQIPADRSNYGTFTLLEEGAERDLHAILEEASRAGAPKGSDTQKIGDYYASFMDEATVERLGLTPLADEFARIDAIKTPRDVASYVGHAQRIFVAHPFVLFVAIDEKNSEQYIANLFQTGLGMPDRDYYVKKDDARLAGVREKYRVWLKDFLAAGGVKDAAAAADSIYAIETKLATAHWTRVQNRDAEKTYNLYDRAAVAKLMPSFDWSAFFARFPSRRCPRSWSRSRATSRRSTG
jgi:predicted metalloendopeptidase